MLAVICATSSSLPYSWLPKVASWLVTPGRLSRDV